MKKYFSFLILLLIQGCSSGGGDSSTTPASPSSVHAGIYSGTVTATGNTPDSAVAFISSTGKVAIIDTNTLEGFIGTISGSALSGTLYSTTSVPATGQVSTVSGDNISGTYTSSLGGGTFALVADQNLYNRGSSLSKLEGTWVDSVFTNITGISTWVIQSDGSFTLSTSSGCSGTGLFSIIDSSFNEYNLNMNVTNCTGYDGAYSGIAVTSDTFNTDDSISLVFSNGSIGGLSEPIYSIPTATGIASQKNMSIIASDPKPAIYDATTGVFTMTEVEITVKVGNLNNQLLTDAHIIFFATEWGLINPSCITVNGECSVTWQTSSFQTIPSDFLNTITAWTLGEETFTDSNANGVFDDNDVTFEDREEPFVDANRDDTFNSGDMLIDVVNGNDPTGINGAHDIGDGFLNSPNCIHSSLCSTVVPTSFIWVDIQLDMAGP